MDVLLDGNSSIHIVGNSTVLDRMQSLEQISMEYAYDVFLQMKDDYLSKNEENYKKYKYALKLRREAANKIGIENIKKGKLARLDKEEMQLSNTYEAGKSVYPDFKLMLMIELEA